MKLVCVCNTAPDHIHTMLMEAGIDKKDIRTLVVGTKSKAPKAPVLFVLTYPDFNNNLEVLNSKPFAKTTVFLFAPAIRVKPLTNCKFLDVSRKAKDIDLVKSSFIDPEPDRLKAILDSEFPPKPVRIRFEDFQAKLIDNVRSGSLLNPMMTMLYGLKSSMQIKVREEMFNWFFSGKKIEALEKSLGKAGSWGVLTKSFRTKLFELLESEIGKGYRAAFKHIGEQMVKKNNGEDVKVNYGGIAKKFKLDPYEIRYICNAHYRPPNKSIEGKSLHNIYYARTRNSHKLPNEQGADF